MGWNRHLDKTKHFLNRPLQEIVQNFSVHGSIHSVIVWWLVVPHDNIPNHTAKNTQKWLGIKEWMNRLEQDALQTSTL